MKDFIDVDKESTTTALNQVVAEVNDAAGARYVAKTDTSAVTLTGANVASTGQHLVVVNMTGTLGAGANVTTPTAANWAAALTDGQVGQTYVLRIINSSSGNYAWTVVGGTGVTVTGTATVAQNTWRDFIVTYTSATAIGLQGTGTYS